MQLLDLQDKLRAHIRARIERGELTGTGLSRQAGFQQGHLSNFLHARRGLSVESMDRLLASLEIGVLDLVDADEIQARMPQSQDALESVVVVSIEQATRSARFSAEQVREAVSFRRSFLRRLKPNDTVNRSDWLRFVLIKLEAAAAAGVFPGITDSASLLLDRHYNSLRPYHRAQPNIYVVGTEEHCLVGQVTLAGENLIVRPRNPQLAVELIRIQRGRSYSDYIAGRVCHASLTL